MKKTIPTFKTDAEAERFVDTADLSEYDLSGLTPVSFEFEKKTAQLNMRLPKSLLEAVKKRASARGIPYTRFIREAVEMALARPEAIIGVLVPVPARPGASGADTRLRKPRPPGPGG
jgi:predicted DNA binding CopG/RHH family protein